MKKVMSLLLALVMALSLLPTAAWAEGNGNGLTNINVGGRNVYFAAGMEQGRLQGGGDVMTDKIGTENMPVFVYKGAGAGSHCFLAVDRSDFTEAPTLTYQVEGDTDAIELHAVGSEEQDKYVYELIVPEIEENYVNYLFDLPRADGSKDGFAVIFRNPDEDPGPPPSGGDSGNQGEHSFDAETKLLVDSGFTAPKNVQISFPNGLERGVDYDYTLEGMDLRIVLRKTNGGANWIKAANSMETGRIGLDMQIDVQGEAGDEYAATVNGNGGFDYIMNLEKVTSREFYWRDGKPCTGGGANIGSVNRVDGLLTVVATADMNHHRFCVVWGDQDGTITRKEMVNIYIKMENGPFAVNDTYQQASAISAERLANLITLDSKMEGKWNVSYENGKILLVAKETLENGDCNIGKLDWTKLAAPESGYTLEGWKRTGGNGSEGNGKIAMPVYCRIENGCCYNNMIFQVTWKDADGRELVEELNILATSSGKPYYARVTLGGKTAKAIDNLGLDANKLRDAGIHFTYDKDLGYFHAYYDKDRMPDYDALVGTRITLTPPAGAKTFRRVHEDGNGDPRCDNEDMTQRTQGMLENEKPFRVEDGSEEAVQARSIQLVQVQEIRVDGIRVCVSRTKNYRSVTVAWYDENGNVIGIDYVYGQNDDFVQRTRLKGVANVEGITDKNECGEVNAPVAVGAEGAELICDRYPQAGNNRTQYFELTLLRDSHQDSNKTIYIPYGYFGLRYEDIQGNLDEQPEIIVHHYNADRSDYEELKGRYTPQGIAFDTKDFSPFTVSLGGSQGGEHSGVMLSNGPGRGMMISSGMEDGWLFYNEGWGVQGEHVGPNGSIPAFRLGMDNQRFLLALENNGSTTPPRLVFNRPEFCGNDVQIEYLGLSAAESYHVYAVDFAWQIDQECTVHGNIDYGNGSRSDIDLIFEPRYGDNIGEFECRTDGKDWDGETDLRYMVIKSLCNMDGGQDVIELGVNWRSREIGDVQNVGITPEVLNEMAAAKKPVVLYGAWNVGMTIPAAAVSDMAAKLTAMNQSKSENPALLWLKVEYWNCDGPAGNAYAFCVRAYLGDTHYVLPGNLNYTFRLDGQVNNYKAFTLYCPEDQDEVSTALVEQENDISYTDERGQSSDDSWRVYEFAANHDGMFVIAPKVYDVKQNWPWYGVPLPRWHPSDEAIKPTRADAALQALYDNDAFGENGFKFPVLDEDIHFTFPVELKEWEEGCGDDWDYRLIQEPAAGRVTIKVNLGSRDRWERAVRNSNDGALSDGVFFGYYFGNSTYKKPMDYGFDWYGGSAEDMRPTYELTENYCHSNAIHLASLNQQTANSTMLTMSRAGERWQIILIMDDHGTNIAGAAVKYALQLKIEATEDVSIIMGADNGVPADNQRIHVTGLHSDWTALVPADGSVFLRTIAGKNYDSAGTDNQNKIGTLTVDAPAGYTLKEWTSTHERGAGTTNSVPLQKDYFQTVKFLWVKAGAPDILENVVVECQNNKEVFFELEEGNVKVKIPTEQGILPAAKQRVLEDNGVTVTYDESNGYFVTAVDAHEIKDIAQLETKLTVPAPRGAVAYKYYTFGGNGNPANAIGEMDKARNAMDATTPISIEEKGLPSVELIQLREVELENGMKVYYAGSQMYNCMIVRWLDEGGNILEYSCTYGRNGNLSTAVDTNTVAQAPTTAVDVPTLVGEGELYCDITPQTKMDNQMFLLLRVGEGTEIGPDGAAIYLPYSDFGMTAEQGLALAAQGVKPVIWHYLNESCTEKEIIEGEYTTAGIRFVTKSFSPFLINAVQTAGGETGGGSTGGGSTDGGSSSGWSGPQGWTLKTSDKAASATDYSGGIYGLTFKSSASFASFQGVQVDGKTIAAKNYIAEAGSIEVYLKAVYLQTLKDGKHTVTILSSEGNVTMEFTVGGVNTSPTTGDMGVALYAVLALGSIGGMAVLPRRRREK